MMKRKMFEVGLLLMIHGRMIKLAMMKMFLKLIMMWIGLAPQLMSVWRVIGRMGMRMAMAMRMGMGLRVLEFRVGVGHLHLRVEVSHLHLGRQWFWNG
jgi:hypothetical protein